MLDTLTSLAQPWADLFAESAWLPTAIITLHVVAMFLGGGIAVAADRRVVQSAPDRRAAFLAAVSELAGTHTIVIGALVLTVLSGIALFAADVNTFWSSWVFWAKMGGFVLLVVNGVRMRTTEARLLQQAGETEEEPLVGAEITMSWATLRVHAWASLSLWLLVVVLGVVVANV